MKTSLAQLQARRQSLLQQMAALDRLRRGSLSRQYFRTPGSLIKQGPYYVLQGYFRGRKFSERIPAEQVCRVKPLVANYRRFVKLAEQFIRVTDQLTQRTLGSPHPSGPLPLEERS